MRAWLLPLLRDRAIRLLWLLPLAAAGLFTLVSLAPIDPVQSYVGARVALVGEAQREAIAAAWGLNDPAPERFLLWARNALSGDLGDSITFNAPVLQVIADRVPASLAVVGAAFVVSFVLRTALGILAAVTRGRWPDRAIRWRSALAPITGRASWPGTGIVSG